MRIFSGIQPTGRKHLGNYIGAIRHYVEAQERGEAIFCIVDLHATTVSYDPADLRRYVLDTAAMLLAAGLDPDRCILFRQSDRREHTELCWLLCSVTAHGDLNRMHQFKEKSARQRELVSAGLFLYPVLQAADILAYKTDEVPVGDDQRQHVELTRDIAERFNQRFGETLVVPRGVYPEEGARIKNLQEPERLMSTTRGAPQGVVRMIDEPEVIRKKFKTAVTDSGRDVVRSEEKPGISNLIEIMAVATPSSIPEVETRYDGQGYGRFKEDVGEAVVELLTPIQQRYQELRADEGELRRLLAVGADKAAEASAPTLEAMYERMGFVRP